jgi:hypothetical protein
MVPCAADRLAAVACYFNPCGYRRLRDNHRRFRAAWHGAPLFTVEVSYDGRFDLQADWQLHASECHILWQKEALLNWAVRQLPGRFDRVAWVDADLLFLNPDWAAATSRLLDEFPVVQLFERCHYANRCGVIEGVWPSLVHQRTCGSKQFGKQHGLPGGAWAARRDLLERHGLYAGNVIGGGDTVFAQAVLGLPTPRRWPPGLRADARRWSRGVYREVAGRVGCTPGDVVHAYHGRREHRQYVERTAILRETEFDPRTDVRVGDRGLLEWSSSKPELHRRVRAYFESRREDE